MSDVEIACTAEVFLLSAVHSGVKHVVIFSPCTAGMSEFDYIPVLDDILKNLDCYGITPKTIYYDAAALVVKELKLLASCQYRNPQMPSFEE